MGKDNLTLLSGIDKLYKRDFIVNTDKIKKLKTIFENAIKKYGKNAEIVFYVYREDDRFFDTKNLDPIFSYPNADEKKIVTLNIEIRQNEPGRYSENWQDDYIAQIIFNIQNQKEPIRFRVFSQNKDWALLLADEIDPHLESMQVKNGLSDFLLIPFYTLLVLLSLFVVFKGSWFIEYSNYFKVIIELPIFIFYFYISYATLNIKKARSNWIRRLLGPESVFYWGAQIDSYDRRKNNRDKLLWGVIVGLVISLVAGAFFYFL